MKKNTIAIPVGLFVQASEDGTFQKLVSIYRGLLKWLELLVGPSENHCWGCLRRGRAVLEEVVAMLLLEQEISPKLIYAHSEIVREHFALQNDKLRIKGCVNLDMFIAEIKVILDHPDYGAWLDDVMFGRL